MVRAEKKAAYAYIGSCPSTYWLNDYYFGVGATARADGTMPLYEETTMGFYDAMWTDNAYNTVTSMMFIGNLASNAAQALGYAEIGFRIRSTFRSGASAGIRRKSRSLSE